MSKESPLSRKISRREFGRKLFDTAVATSAVALSAGTLTYLAIEANEHQETLYGKPIEEQKKKELLTHVFGDEEYIPLREEPNMGELVGITLPNYRSEEHTSELQSQFHLV